MERPFAPDAEPDPGTAPRICLMACSPHADGTTDTAARLLEQALSSCGASVELIHLRDHAVHPCTGCGHCSAHPGHCVFEHDDAPALFDRIRLADRLVLVLPVYFYGPPALLKGFIDRAQLFWANPGPTVPPRPASAVLCAARARGERLFEASLLILRCFLDTLGFDMQDPLLLRGTETPADLRGRTLELQHFGIRTAGQVLHHD